MRFARVPSIVLLVALCIAPCARAAGILTPVGSPEVPIQIQEHRVVVAINNGFARTQVRQVFFNPNEYPLDALYAFPVPERASLSDVTSTLGERVIRGEVVERPEAERIYTEEREQGRDAGIATKNGYQRFEFAVGPIAAQGQIALEFVYYEPLSIDTGVGRYLYPLEDGGTDDAASSFWTASPRVNGAFSVEVDVASAWPVADVRVPGFEAQAEVRRIDAGRYHVRVEQVGADLSRDFALYYRLRDDLPGRVEVIPYRASERGPGTFMAIVTPGIDLAPLRNGADWVFVLDVSGSMRDKIRTLGSAVASSLGKLRPEDRFRIITFSDHARELTSGWTSADASSVAAAADAVRQLHEGGSTNLYAGVAAALRDLDADRATSVVLVTDAVANVGEVDPAAFRALAKRYDVRVFGFLLGNGANWPLMRAIAEASGGFYAPVSNADDMLGQILLAKSKIAYEALHDASFELRGVETRDVVGLDVGKIYRGQQLVLFGRYARPGRATLELRARLTGEDRTYTTTFDFPAQDTAHPELERLWAMRRVDELESRADAGLADRAETDAAVAALGVDYQIVTDQTSMLLLSDEGFQRRGIERRNAARVDVEREAQAQRAQAPPQSHRVDAQRPTYPSPAPSIGRTRGGGGAIDPISGVLGLALAASALRARGRKGRS
jgi:Ca-activated chloride channel homolog